jgi:glycosyltransferase involved in cell wall biosynthesis
MKKFSPLLSIITVCLNEPQLERTCESIINQTFQDFEWIVIDGGSNDETLAVFEKYKCRMDYFISEPDEGIYFGMNKGIAQATGEWLNFMNAGDMFANRHILLKIFGDGDDFENVDVLYGTADLGEKRIYAAPVEFDKIYFYSTSLPHQASFIRRVKCRLYDTTYSFCADQRLFIALYDAGAAFMPLDCVVCVQAENGISIRMHCSQQKIDERKRIKRECFTEEEQRQAESRLIGIYKQFVRDKSRDFLQRL